MKNPLRKMRPNTIRILYSFISMIVLALCVMNFISVMVYNVQGSDECGWRPRDQGKQGLLISDVIPDGVADKAGIKNGDILLKVNGLDFQNANRAQRIIDSIRIIGKVVYTIERDNKQFETEIEIVRNFDVFFLSLFSLGLGFLIVGFIVVMTKPQGETQQLFGGFSLWTMLFFGLFITRLDPQHFAQWQILTARIGLFAALIFAPPVFIRFFLYFPVRKKAFDNRWITVSLYSVSVINMLTILFRQQLVLPPFVGVINPLILIGSFTTGLGIFIHAYFSSVEQSRKKQLKPILIGSALGLIAFSYIFAILLIKPFLFLQLIFLLPIALVIGMPLAFGYSIFRYRLMDIDLIIKRSLIYGVITATLAAIYLMIVFGIGNLLSYFLGMENNQVMNAVAFISIALVFDPIKRKTQDWIDRSFYQERYNYQKALLEFSQELPRLMNLEQILDSMANRISGTMHVEKIAIILCDEIEGCYSLTKNIPKHYSDFVQQTNGLIALLQTTKKPLSLALLDVEPDSIPIIQEDREKIIKSGIVLSVPMFIQDRMVGTINVGPKMSGKIYSQEDIDLLSTVASQAAIAIENARLHKSEIEKQKMEEQLEIARKIQQSLFPKTSPQLEHLDIAGISIPALTVGGDYFDYILLDPKRLLVVVADVSGKGMSAALYMSKIQGMIQLASHMYTTPREMLIHVNRRLYDGIERKSFITMVLALFNLENNTVQICRAGHNKAIIGSNNKLEHLNSKGIGLGLERGPIFEENLEEVQRSLSSDSIFFFYSDGLSEAMNETQQQYGEDAICDFIKANKTINANHLQRSLVSAVKHFQGSAEQHDDITFVVVKYN
ncbi:MAG: SpoIIE family protein phosphatase [Ignavibacteriales bacterium]|nr:SpoIIE family protein phosphatase [Ignavibacteriales bacterium]